MIFDFVQATEKDKTYLLNLRKLTMVEHLENSGQFLSDDEHKFRLNNAYECSHLIKHENNVIGTLKYCEYEHKVEIMQVQIHPQFQCKGYGSAVIKQIMTGSKPKVVELTVLKKNPALNLYKKLGFYITGEDQYEYLMQAGH